LVETVTLVGLSANIDDVLVIVNGFSLVIPVIVESILDTIKPPDC
jgi:hypothetical protein